MPGCDSLKDSLVVRHGFLHLQVIPMALLTWLVDKPCTSRSLQSPFGTLEHFGTVLSTAWDHQLLQSISWWPSKSEAIIDIQAFGSSAHQPYPKLRLRRSQVVDSVDFQVSLVGAPSIRIDVTGSDLTVLDALAPWRSPRMIGMGQGWATFLGVVGVL